MFRVIQLPPTHYISLKINCDFFCCCCFPELEVNALLVTVTWLHKRCYCFWRGAGSVPDEHRRLRTGQSSNFAVSLLCDLSDPPYPCWYSENYLDCRESLREICSFLSFLFPIALHSQGALSPTFKGPNTYQNFLDDT